MIALAIPYTVKEKYKTVLDQCRFLELASPRLMQELDTWNWHSSLKEIRKMFSNCQGCDCVVRPKLSALKRHSAKNPSMRLMGDRVGSTGNRALR
jgi:hypothetical protein